jgi:putative membrane protein
MTATQGNLAGLSRFIFRAPRWYTSVIFALVLAAATGIAAFDSRFVLEDAWQGVFFVGIPTIIASVGTSYVDNRLSGQLTPNRASLLALFCELIVITFLIGAGIISTVTVFAQEFVLDALLMGLAAIFALRLLVVMAVSRHSLPVAAIPASIQTAAAAALLSIYSGTTAVLLDNPVLKTWLSRPEKAPAALQFVELVDFALLGVMCLLYAGAVWLFLVFLDRPWRSSMGVSVLDFIQGFIGHVAEGTRELEDFFEDIGEEALVPVTVLSVRRPDGEEKVRFVLPMIHPGPMGEIGGGNLPRRVAAEADGLAFPPHATAGHDFNLVTEREVDTILSAAETAYQRLEYTDEATAGHRIEEGEAKLLGQAVGDSALLVSTFAPGFADDIEYAVGLSAVSEARADALEEVMLVDAHNSNNGLEGEDLGHVVPGSQRSFDMIYGAGKLGDRLSDADRGSLRCGVAWDETDWTPTEGIGPLGIRVAVFEVADTRTAYVLVDGNNMEPGLRDQIIDALDGVDDAEVMTTDTHIVNTVEAENQVGQAIPDEELIALIADLTDRAVADLEPVEAGVASEKATVTVFGNDRTETLASTANAVVSLGGALAVAFICAVFAISVLIFFLTGA